MFEGGLLHTVHNTFVDPLGAGGLVSMLTALGFIVSPVVGVGMAALWLGVELALRRVRAVPSGTASAGAQAVSD